MNRLLKHLATLAAAVMVLAGVAVVSAPGAEAAGAFSVSKVKWSKSTLDKSAD